MLGRRVGLGGIRGEGGCCGQSTFTARGEYSVLGWDELGFFLFFLRRRILFPDITTIGNHHEGLSDILFIDGREVVLGERNHRLQQHPLLLLVVRHV